MRGRTGKIAVLALFVLSLTGFGRMEGYDVIDRARAAYAALDSGRLTITDVDTGGLVQDFTFRYEDGALTYLYEGTGPDGTFSCEYGDGETRELYTDGQWAAYAADEDGYVRYTRKRPHQNASKDIFFLLGSCVEQAEITELPDGGQTIRYVYSPAKLSGKLAGQLRGGKLTAFETVYTLDASGGIEEMIEQSTVSGPDGDSEWAYKLVISDENAVEAIEKPEVDKR